MRELDEKADRLARLAHSEGAGGILVNTQPNFAWLTGGRSNRIDGSRENGNGSLLVTARGDRYVVANNIEMPRLQEEALAGLGFKPLEYRWTSEHADTLHAHSGSPGCRRQRVRHCLRWGARRRQTLEAQIAAERSLLTDEEVERYRAFGRDMGVAVGEACRALVPGLDEQEVARRAQMAVEGAGARAVVTLVAADDRIARFRHPAPTAERWRHSVMVVICAQRAGLTVALSRIVMAETPSTEFVQRTEATTTVFERLVGATKAGVNGAELLTVAAKAYADAGFPGEEGRHHQGGAIGYRSRDWVAHPASRDLVQCWFMAFAWNPSITGTKVEETALLTPDGIELLTTSPGWPAIPISAGGRALPAPGWLTL